MNLLRGFQLFFTPPFLFMFINWKVKSHQKIKNFLLSPSSLQYSLLTLTWTQSLPSYFFISLPHTNTKPLYIILFKKIFSSKCFIKFFFFPCSTKSSTLTFLCTGILEQKDEKCWSTKYLLRQIKNERKKAIKRGT